MNLKIHVLLSLGLVVFGTLGAVALIFLLNSEEGALATLLDQTYFFIGAFLLVAFIFSRRLFNSFEQLLPRESKFDTAPADVPEVGWTKEAVALVLVGLALPMGEGAAFGTAGILLILMLHARFWRELPYQPLVAAVGQGFVCWVAFGFVAIMSAPEGWVRPQELGRLLPFVLFPVVAWSVSRLPPQLVAKAASTFIAVLGFSCVFALYQYFSNLHENISFMEALGFISAKHQVHAPGQGGRLVAGGFYFHRLKMAHVLLLGASFLVSRQVFSSLDKKARLVEGGVLLLFVSTLFLTYTRAALLGLGAGGFVIIWFASKRWKAAGLTTGVLVLLIALSYSPIRERVLSIGDAAASNERVLLWSTALDVIEDRQWGMGLGNYPSLIDGYYAKLDGAANLPRTYAHNVLLSTWAETGPFGAMGYVWMWVCVGLACFWRLRKSEFSRTHYIAAAGLMALIAMWTVGLTHDVLYHKPVCLTFAAFMGAVVGALDRQAD